MQRLLARDLNRIGNLLLYSANPAEAANFYRGHARHIERFAKFPELQEEVLEIGRSLDQAGLLIK